MSDESDISPEISPTPAAAETPRVRRVSTPRPKKKVAKSIPVKAAVKEELPAAEAEAPVVDPPAPEEIPAVDSVEAPEAEESSTAAGGEWPEPEAATTGGAAVPGEGGKRKRRRRKGKGGQAGGAPSGAAAMPQAASEDAAPAAAEPKAAEGFQEQRPRPNPQPQPQAPQRPKIDSEYLSKMAWKIYLAEVSEEGVALIGDNDAKDLSRRCFRLAEIFIEEQSRRR